jgi:type III secretion protein L
VQYHQLFGNETFVNKSKKKLFSLLYGSSIHIAPNTKVIPADQFSIAIGAKNVLLAAQTDVDRYRDQVAAECEKIKEQAAKEGYEEGFAQWVEHIAKLEQHITDVAQVYEKVIVAVAIKAAKKILGTELQTRQNAIVEIVSNVLKSVAQHKKIVIYVNKDHIESLENRRGDLKDLFEDLQSLSIRERADLQEGECVIETEGGIINAQLSNQWAIFEQAFTNILKNKDAIAARATDIEKG